MEAGFFAVLRATRWWEDVEEAQEGWRGVRDG
jgi:hypothetical protein